MGYSVEIELREVKFEKKDAPKVVEILKKYNKEVLLPKSMYGRFSDSLTKVEDIFEELRYEIEEHRNHFHVVEFYGDNLGGDDKMWKLLAPLLWDCEVVFDGEDGCGWKHVIKDGKVETVHREEL